MVVSLNARFRGCLLGLAIGDALGGRFEAQDAEHIRGRFSTPSDLMNHGGDELWYTDDTQMAIGVAECLVDCGRIVESRLCQAFVENYMPSRGYGRGARAVLDAMEDGRDHQAVAQNHFPGGSFGNGAAMRVAPVGLFFRVHPEACEDQARLSALPTHTHAHGIEGAQLLAAAVGYVSHDRGFDRSDYFHHLLECCESPEYRSKLEMAAGIVDTAALGTLGNGIAALESVPTAICCFALTPDSYEDVLANAIFLGGDTDTIAAMACAIAGAHLGIDAIPAALVDRLERSPKGGAYIAELADRLCDAHVQSARESSAQ